LKIVANELAKYNLHLLAVHEVRWVEGDGKLSQQIITYFSM